VTVGEGVKELATALQRVVGGPDSPPLDNEYDSACNNFSAEPVGKDGLFLDGAASGVTMPDGEVDAGGHQDSQADEEEEDPPPLDPTDPDVWLFNLTEEELLALEASEGDAGQEAEMAHAA
jgi:hypothetical protein